MSHLSHLHSFLAAAATNGAPGKLPLLGSRQPLLFQSAPAEKFAALIYTSQFQAVLYVAVVILTLLMIVKTVGRLKKTYAGPSKAYLARQRAGFANRHSRRPARWAHLLR